MDSDSEYETYFEGPCTCDHDRDQHDWFGCTVEGCDCKAYWTE